MRINQSARFGGDLETAPRINLPDIRSTELIKKRWEMKRASEVREAKMQFKELGCRSW